MWRNSSAEPERRAVDRAFARFMSHPAPSLLVVALGLPALFFSITEWHWHFARAQ